MCTCVPNGSNHYGNRAKAKVGGAEITEMEEELVRGEKEALVENKVVESSAMYFAALCK